jgi:hypothetical protein
MKDRIHDYIKVYTLYFDEDLFFVGTIDCPYLRGASSEKEVQAKSNHHSLLYENGMLYCAKVCHGDSGYLCPNFVSCTNTFIVCNHVYNNG